ncbi:unannotated protein [freshwater metagenome]|uniref:Unannotated protein n=1 Tax=freshwater metagenome TaxID=449393 RepID=A0A6J6AS17_9ZZZZ
MTGDVVMVAVKIDWTCCEQALDDGDGFGHAVDANTWAIKRNAGLLVIGCHPPGTDTELEATTT